MHHADRVVVLLGRRDLEHRVTGFHLGEPIAEQGADRRMRQAAVADGAQEFDAGQQRPACASATGSSQVTERLRFIVPR